VNFLPQFPPAQAQLGKCSLPHAAAILGGIRMYARGDLSTRPAGKILPQMEEVAFVLAHYFLRQAGLSPAESN